MEPRQHPPPGRTRFYCRSRRQAMSTPSRRSCNRPTRSLDLSGEDIRKSLYLTTDPSGEELCLRPDLTIPVARDYLASPRAGKPAGFSYLGPVFPLSRQSSQRVPAGGRGHPSAVRIAPRRMPRCSRWPLEATRGVRRQRCRNPHRRCGAVQCADRRARPSTRSGGGGWFKDFNRKINLAEDIERLTLATAARAQRI